MYKLLMPLPTKIDNINYSSGSFYSIYTSLKKYFDIILTGPLILKKSHFLSGLNYLYDRKLFPKQFSTLHSWKTINSYSKQLQEYVEKYQFDAIFSTSTLYAAKMKTNKPVFAYTDFSYFNALNYYPVATNVMSFSKKQALEVDKYCFDSYKKVFLASNWAKEETTKAYGLDNNKIIPIGRGANLESGFNHFQLEKMVEKRTFNKTKKFLFVGVDWIRKGGDIAFYIVRKLREFGYDVTFQVVGCNPPPKIRDQPFVETYPFLSRDNTDELQILISLFTNAWCFIMPTRAEAMGIAFAEAASFGLPCVAMRTGGIEAAITDNQTGLLFNFTDTINIMVKRVKMILDDQSLYKSMSIASFDKYKKDLNWDSIAQKIQKEIVTFL